MTQHPPVTALTRRALLAGSGGVLAAASMSGCGFFSLQPTSGGDRRPDGPKGREAPDLATRVRSGTLPPVDERISQQPMVVHPVEREGVYGGTWRTALTGPDDGGWLYKTVGYEPLLRWDPLAAKVGPNVAASVQVSRDSRTLTLRLRPGMKWSDGHAFSTDDVVFSYRDVLLDTELAPDGPPAWLRSGGRADGDPARLVQLDQTTFELQFAEPSGLALYFLADAGDGLTLLRPAHYLKRFHRKYVDVDPLIKRAGAQDYAALFYGQAGSSPLDAAHWQSVDLPRLTPWVVKEPLGSGGALVVTRNPYYWKTDPSGSQLPYLDEVSFAIVQDPTNILQLVLNGQIDLHQRHINTADNKPVVVNGEQRGGYRVFASVDTFCNFAAIMVNQTHADPVQRDIFSRRDFRVGLSYAIDRDQINQTVLAGLAQPWQSAPRRDSGFYHERLATQYLRHDQAAANQHLDRAGLSKRDGNGRRLGPDGRPVRFTLTYALGIQPSWSDIAVLVRGYWQAVGIDVAVKGLERGFAESQVSANKHDVYLYTGQGGGPESVVNPVQFAPCSAGGPDCAYAPRWAAWYASQGKTGERPPPAVRRQLAILDRIRGTVATDQRRRLMLQLLDIAADEFYVIGTALLDPGSFWGVVADTMHNLREARSTVLVSGTFPSPGTTHPEQLYKTDS